MTKTIKPVESAEATADATSQDIGFLHAGLIQCALPRVAFDGEEFIRTNGNRMLIIRPGVLGPSRIQQPIPYGPLGRLLMVYICTKAVEGKFRQEVVDLEGSANAFMRSIGVATSGQGYKNLRVQMNAIIACEMAFIKGEGDGNFKGRSLRPVLDVAAREITEGGTPDVWPRGLVLSRDFLAELEGKAVPLDYEALAKLKGSALALDAYAWLAYKLPSMNRADDYLSWEALKGQFGHEYRDAKVFARNMKGAIEKALSVYPGAKVEFPHGRVKLFKCAPPIGRRLVAVSALPAPDKPSEDTGLGCDALEMDDKLIELFTKAARNLPRGFDRYAVLAAYKRHMTGKPRPKYMRNDCIYWAIGEHKAGRL